MKLLRALLAVLLCGGMVDVGAGCTPAARGTAATIVGGIGPTACGALVPLLGPDGAFAGTACQAIATLISEGLRLGKVQAAASRPACDRLIPIAKQGRAAQAWVCPGVEAAAQAAVEAQP